jgi:pilus assembly protein CpaC
LFGSNLNQENEIELLIMVTPELVDAMNPHEVPTCLPGMMTDVPNDCELYSKRYIEVPKCCPPGSEGTCPDGNCPQGGAPLEGSSQGEVYENIDNGNGDGQLPGLILQPTPAETIDRPAPNGPTAVPGSAAGVRNENTQSTASRYARPSNRYMPSNQNGPPAPSPNRTRPQTDEPKTLPGFIGPVGYDVVR